MSSRQLPGLRHKRSEKAWKDEVKERVRKRRSERASGADPLPLFPDQLQEAPDPPPVPESPAVAESRFAPAPCAEDFERAPIGDLPLAPRTGSPSGFQAPPLDLSLRAPEPSPRLSEIEVQQVDEPEGVEGEAFAQPGPAAELEPQARVPQPWRRFEPELAASDEPEPSSPARSLSWEDPLESPAPVPSREVERPATMEERLNAAAIDSAVLSSVFLVAIYLASRATQVDLTGLLAAWPGLVSFLALLGLGYAAWFTGSTGQTPGKMAVGLRVVDRSGQPLGVARALLRVLLALLGAALVGVGFVSILFDPARRALHDRLLSARVIRS